MIGIIAAISFYLQRDRHMRLLRSIRRSPRNRPTPPLPDTFINPKGLALVPLTLMKAQAHQPQALCQEHQQEESGQNLRPAKAFAGEKSPHRQKASVLPCLGTVLETSADGRTARESDTQHGAHPAIRRSRIRVSRRSIAIA